MAYLKKREYYNEMNVKHPKIKINYLKTEQYISNLKGFVCRTNV